MIELTEASFSYGGPPILADISLSLAPGSFHFVTGPSGAGKSTFLKMCYLALRPTAGRMSLLGQDVAALDRDGVARLRRRIGVMHQDCQFLDHLDLQTNVALPLTVAGKDPSGHSADLTDLLAWVDLTPRAAALPPELSGGERQRAALARAVITAPDLIIADEPTGNIDWAMAERILTLLLELNRMGKTVLIATHDLNLIRHAKSEVQTRVLQIRSGRVRLAGADL